MPLILDPSGGPPALLKVFANNQGNPLSLDLSNFMDLTAGKGMDPYNPAFTDKVFARSLLREGGTLALESLQLKELAFPLLLNVPASQGTVGLNQLVVLLNQIINSPGAVCEWQDAGASQPTYFDLASGQFDIEYDYRHAEKLWLPGKLRLFAQPLGRTAGPRQYAAASGVGPLLMISPYASGGANILSASGAGFGGQQQPSGGVQYFGAPSLAGDAQSLLQISYTGPLPVGATGAGTTPYVAVSVLPDQYYQPLITVPEMTTLVAQGLGSLINQSAAVASQYINLQWPSTRAQAFFSFSPLISASAGIEPTVAWTGNHRLFAIARASRSVQQLTLMPGPLVQKSTGASINPGDWGLYDLGTFTLRPSEYPSSVVTITAVTAAPSSSVDVTAFVMLPDSNTWLLNPTQIQGSQYGYPQSVALNFTVPSAPYTNTLLIDDVLSDQFIYAGGSQTATPAPAGMAASSSRVTPYSRGLVPRPQPYVGMPIVAIVSVAQPATPSTTTLDGLGFTVPVPGASWSSQQNLRTMAQVNVQERTRYVFP